LKIAFYKGKGTIFDKLIRLWTFSKYSHVELVNQDSPDNWLWYTSSPRDGGVVVRNIEYNADHWDLFDINIPHEQDVLDFIQTRVNKKYDWLGIILSQILKLNIHNQNRWFCSEIIHAALIMGGLNNSYFIESHNYNPGKLHSCLISIGAIR